MKSSDGPKISARLIRAFEGICDAFEKEWRFGRQPQIEEYLARVEDSQRAALLRDLLGIELDERGDDPPPTIHEYVERLPMYEDVIRALMHDSPTVTQVQGLTGIIAQPKGPRTLPEITGYDIIEELGRGGMGVVYKAWERALKRTVALKVILVGEHADEQQIGRFRVEAEAAARLQHANIVQIHQIGDANGLPYFSLEYVDGGSLAAKIDGTPLPPRHAATIVQTLAEAMQYAHDHGVVHRDLKPANVLLSHASLGEGMDEKDLRNAKITDFGLAKCLDSGAAQTQSGAIMGTPSYMAPEQAAARIRDIGPAADVYALGAILYELLTGRPPFIAPSAMQTLAQVVADEPVMPRKLNSRVPRDLETICTKCLRKGIPARYGNALQLADDLRRFLDGKPIVARPTGRAERLWKWAKRKPSVAALVAVSFLAVVTLAVVGWWTVRRQHILRADSLIENLCRAESSEMPKIMAELDPYQQWTTPQLVRLASDSPLESKTRLHASLALLPHDPGQTPYLLSQLFKVHPDQFFVIRDVLHSRRHAVVHSLWNSLNDPAADQDERFRAACALALYDPESSQWNAVGSMVAGKLAQEPPLYFEKWAAALRPVRRVLVEPLVEQLQEATPHRFALLQGLLEAYKDDAIAQIEKNLHLSLAPDWNDAKPASAWPFPERALVQQIVDAHGLLTEHFALCQNLPLDQFDALANGLRPSGFRPVCVRPFVVENAVFVAAVWRRDGKDWKLSHSANRSQIEQADATWQSQGYVPCDVTGYRWQREEAHRTDECFAVLWNKTADEMTEARLFLALPGHTLDQSSRVALVKAGFVPVTQAPYGDGSGARYCGIWGKRRRVPHNVVDRLADNVRSYETETPPHHLQMDVRLWHPSDAERRLHTDPADTSAWFARYASVWEASTQFASVAVHGVDVRENVQRWSKLVADNYRPIAVSVCAQPGEGSLLAASLWHRPVVPESANDALAKRQAQAAVALLQFGRAESVWPLLTKRPDQRLRTFLSQYVTALGASPKELAKRLKAEPDPAVRQTIILCLGGFPESALSSELRNSVMPELLIAYRDDPDPGIHSALDWLLRRWDASEALKTIDSELASHAPANGRRWYVNQHGITLTAIRGPVECQCGLPAFQADGDARSDPLHRRRISRSFAISTKEITVEQFRPLWKADGSVGGHEAQYSPASNGPINAVTWYEAAKYCRWLSEREGVSEEQMCFPPLAEIQPGMKLPQNYLTHTGYRLPTEAEWEYACRAGTITSHYFGSQGDLSVHFAWSLQNSRNRAWPVGQLKPNDLGLFDVHGNIKEWCLGRAQKGSASIKVQILEDRETTQEVNDDILHAVRGGGFNCIAEEVHSATREWNAPSHRTGSYGFRIARTLE